MDDAEPAQVVPGDALRPTVVGRDLAAHLLRDHDRLGDGVVAEEEDPVRKTVRPAGGRDTVSTSTLSDVRLLNVLMCSPRVVTSRSVLPAAAFTAEQAISSRTGRVARFRATWPVLPEGIVVEPSPWTNHNVFRCLAADCPTPISYYSRTVITCGPF